MEKGRVFAVEADLGHVAPAKFAEKLRGYEAFALSGECGARWGCERFCLMVVTTGQLRASGLRRLLPELPFPATFVSHEAAGIPFPGAWS